MVKFKFFVHCGGVPGGGYENAHFASNAKEAHRIIDGWNFKNPGSVSLISISEISHDEFLEDFVGCYL